MRGMMTLLKLGANADLKDNVGQIAYDYILENEHLKNTKARLKLYDLWIE